MTPGGSYPLGLEVAAAPRVERWRPLLNWLLTIPHFLWLYVLHLGAGVLVFLGWFAIVFGGRMPDTWSDYLVGTLRYQWRLTAYLYGWTLQYPSFAPVAGHIDPGDTPAILYCARATERRRVSVFFRAILVIPQLIALWFVGIAAGAVLLVGWFAVLVTGRWPDGLRNFAVGYYRWSTRVAAYEYLLTDEYPPFSLEP